MDAVPILDYAQIGQFEYQSNPWNRGKLVEGRDFTQSIEFGEKTPFRMVWRWPDDTPEVMSYPGLIWGKKPWSTTSTTPSLPRKLDGLGALTVDYSLDWAPQPRGNFNVSFDLWIANALEDGPDTRLSEVMVWVKMWDWTPDETPAARITDATGTAAVYHRPDHADGWNYVAVLYDDDQKTGTLDVTALLGQLAELGLISLDDYLLDIEIGAEIVSGSGWLEFQRYEIALDGLLLAALHAPTL